MPSPWKDTAKEAPPPNQLLLVRNQNGYVFLGVQYPSRTCHFCGRPTWVEDHLDKEVCSEFTRWTQIPEDE